MIRQHQFYKVELVSIVEPKTASQNLSECLIVQKILEKLEIPYQIVLLSSGDMGFSAKKLTILRPGYPQRTNIEKFLAVHLADLFKLEEWEQNTRLKTETILLEL